MRRDRDGEPIEDVDPDDDTPTPALNRDAAIARIREVLNRPAHDSEPA